MTSEPTSGGADLPRVGAPLSLTRTLREAWSVYRLRAPSLIALFLPLYVVLDGIQYAVFRGAGLTGPELPAHKVVLGLSVQFALPALLGSLAAAAAVVLMRDALVGRSTRLGAAARSLAPLARELLASGLVAAMLALLMTLPPFYVLLPLLGSTLVAVLFGPPIVVHVIALERKPLRSAWPRSRALLKKNWARLILYLLVVALPLHLLVGLGAQPAGALSVVALLAVDAVLRGLLVPLLLAVAFMGYLDLREQKDRPAPAS